MGSLRSAVRGRWVVAAVLACSVAWSMPATAAAEQQLQVSPTKTTLAAKAGETLTANITITAPESGIRVTYQHADFGFDDDYQVVLIPDSAPETTSFSTRRWFTVKPPEFTLKANATRTVPVRIKVPDNAPSTTYMGAAIFAVAPSDEAQGGQIQANVSIASLIFISVEGGDPPKAKIRRFDVPKLVARGSFTPELIVDNTGELGFTADGTIRVDDEEPKALQSYAPQYVQPGKPRTLRVQSTDASDTKRRSARVDTSDLSIGKHTVTLRLRIDPTNQTLVVEKTFWVIPMWIRVLAVLLALTLVLGISWLVARGRRNRRDAAATDSVPAAVAPAIADPTPQADPDIPPTADPADEDTFTDHAIADTDEPSEELVYEDDLDDASYDEDSVYDDEDSDR